MSEPDRDQVTRIVGELACGRRDRASELAGLVYENLRRYATVMMAQEHGPRTLQPTALVHEAYLRMVNQSRVDWQGRTHFFAVGAEMIRRVIVDDARRRGAQKRGGGRRRLALEDDPPETSEDGIDVLDLDEALQKLANLDARAARVVVLRYFGGLRETDVAEVLGVSSSTVRDDWRMARAWLRDELSGTSDG